MRLTSVEDGENPFSEGAKPILTSELSGMLGADNSTGMEDPRQWGADLLTETGEFQLPNVADGAWRESLVYDLESPAGSGATPAPSAKAAAPSDAPRSRTTTAPSYDTGEKPQEKKTRYGLWIFLCALIAAGIAAAYYFLVFNK
jgi:hypothetical protein